MEGSLARRFGDAYSSAINVLSKRKAPDRPKGLARPSVPAPSDPAFWCQRCYGDAHYDDSGNLLVPEHRVVDYRGG